MSIQGELLIPQHLNHLKDRAGMSLDEIAFAAGYKGRSSVQKYFKDYEGTSLAVPIVAKLATALLGRGDPPITIAELRPLLIEASASSALTDEALADILNLGEFVKSLGGSTVEPANAGNYPVMGSAHATNWMERSPSLDVPEGWVVAPSKSARLDPEQYVLRIIGPSINRTAQEGHYAICQRFGEGRHPMPDGRFVHVERERKGLFEWTIKKLKWVNEGWLLCPDSDHDDHQKPLDYGDPGNKVRILGVVVGWYKPA